MPSTYVFHGDLLIRRQISSLHSSQKVEIPIAKLIKLSLSVSAPAMTRLWTKVAIEAISLDPFWRMRN